MENVMQSCHQWWLKVFVQPPKILADLWMFKACGAFHKPRQDPKAEDDEHDTQLGERKKGGGNILALSDLVQLWTFQVCAKEPWQMFGKIKLIVATRSGVGIILEYSLSSRFNSQIHKLCVKIPCSDPDRTFEDFARRMKAWAPRDFSAYLVDQQELDWLLLLGWSLGSLNPSNIWSPQVSTGW